MRSIDLAERIAIEADGDDRYAAILHDYGDGRGFGGDTLARVVLAARRSTDPARRLCSFHAWFLRPAPVGERLGLEVERVKEGRQLSQRRVRLLHGERAICELGAVFGIPSTGVTYQEARAPESPPPEELKDDVTVAREEGLDWEPGEVEWRWIERDWDTPEPSERSAWRAWARPRVSLPGDDPGLHEAALALLSDFGSHWSLVRRLGDRGFDFARFASLDQGLWVHRPVRWDDWWLVASESEVAEGGHSFTRRRIFDREARLLATGTQEGLHADPA